MKQEDKELLLKDLCARLSYGFVIHRYSDNVDITVDSVDSFGHFLEFSEDEKFKPYLRPMSSMTEEEVKEFTELIFISDTTSYGYLKECILYAQYSSKAIDWLNAHHFDYHGLLEKELALEALEGMYGKF